MKKYSLVHIGRDTFLILNAKDNLKCNQCNSTIFENEDDAKSDKNVFDYFDLKVNIIIDKLDRRTKKYKQFEKDYQYFSASFLPKIKERVLNNSLAPYKF